MRWLTRSTSFSTSSWLGAGAGQSTPDSVKKSQSSGPTVRAFNCAVYQAACASCIIRPMAALIFCFIGALRSSIRTRAHLAMEKLALRQQLAALRRTSRRPSLRMADRAFWLVLSRVWARWSDVLVVVKPDTVVRGHRAGFRLFWRWKRVSHQAAPTVARGRAGSV
jgi:hypothetical protein